MLRIVVTEMTAVAWSFGRVEPGLKAKLYNNKL